MLKLTNTLSGKKETFTSREPNKVGMYVCGITPYDYAHLGHGRVYVIFDLLYRVLRFLGYDVTYVRNFTDIDDKLLKRAQQELGDEARFGQIAEKFIAAYHEDMAQLGCFAPTHEPRVTEMIPEIIQFVQGLIEKGNAYVANGDVYYAVRSFSDYGKLSKRNIDDLRVGARVQVSDIKKDPLDFALWKATPEGTFWKSPWGYGRPGWHIECSVMVRQLLGDHIDIHAGGMDLIFPHHENEIAQSEGLLGPTFVNYWLHNAFVQINKEKMSKSLGNFFTLRQIFEQFDPMVVRYYILAHHYRVPLDFSFEDLEAAKKTYRRLVAVFEQVDCSSVSLKELKEYPIVSQMLAFLLDDLNTSGMLGVVHKNINLLTESPEQLCAAKKFIQMVLGLPLKPLPERAVEITPEIAKLLQEREKARQEKDWATADTLRDKLQALGVDLRDTKID